MFRATKRPMRRSKMWKQMSGTQELLNVATIKSLNNWYDGADIDSMDTTGSVINAWHDKSSSRNTLTSTGSPVYELDSKNGLPSVVFDGSDDFFTFADAINLSEGALYLMIDLPNDISLSDPGQVILTSESAVSPRNLLGLGSATGGISDEVLTNTLITPGGTEFRYTTITMARGTHLIYFDNSSGDTSSASFDQVEQPISLYGSSDGGFLSGIKRFGRNRNAYTNYLTATVRELIILNEVPSASLNEDIVNYLYQKWDHAFSPKSIVGLVPWWNTTFPGADNTVTYDAETQVVSSIASSGYGSYPASQAAALQRPTFSVDTFNGKSSIVYDGTDRLESSYQWPLEFSAFAVIEPTEFPAAGNADRVLSAYDGTGGLLNGQFLLDILNTTGTNTIRFLGYGVTIVGAIALSVNTKYLFEVHCDASKNITLYVNGVADGTGTHTATTFGYDVTIAGDYAGTPNVGFNGSIPEVMMYTNGALHANQIAALRSYFNSKYDIY